MLASATIDVLTREAKPADFWMLRSYVQHAPSADYVRRVMIPSLRRRHPTIWTRVDSGGGGHLRDAQYRSRIGTVKTESRRSKA